MAAVELEGKVAVVTGGASGIGLAMASRFAREGMRIVVGDIEQGALEPAADALRELGAEAVPVRVDVTDPDSMAQFADAAREAFGGWHVVCLNAGVGTGGPMWELEVSDWEWVLGVNLWGVVHGIRTFVPGLVAQDDGHVVVTASLAGLVATPFMGPYNASKFAAVGVAETLHAELATAAPGVGVSVLCPAWVNTRIFESGRNRPTRLAPSSAPEPREGLDLSAILESAMSPEEVADEVLAAVQQRRLHVLTHEYSAEAIRNRTAAILGDA